MGAWVSGKACGGRDGPSPGVACMQAQLHPAFPRPPGMARTQTATLGGGCFWCVEAALSQLKGVSSVVSGYAGGGMPRPSYDQVCTGTTGHAEVVQATFDPDVVSYRN